MPTKMTTTTIIFPPVPGASVSVGEREREREREHLYEGCFISLSLSPSLAVCVSARARVCICLRVREHVPVCVRDWESERVAYVRACIYEWDRQRERERERRLYNAEKETETDSLFYTKGCVAINYTPSPCHHLVALCSAPSPKLQGAAPRWMAPRCNGRMISLHPPCSGALTTFNFFLARW